MNFIKNLWEICNIDAKLVGWKAANLGELMLNGIPVPRGFVITNNAYQLFIQENKIIKGTFFDDTCDKLLLQKAIIEGIMPKKIKNEIISAYMDLFSITTSGNVAVRSSAMSEDSKTASFAGQMETYLNICGEQNLILAIKKSYMSLWGINVENYRKKRAVPEENKIAVIIQQMIECDVSGVLFTINPITGNHAEVVVNAAYGLGDSVVSGIVSPDEYICDKNGNIISSLLGSKERRISYINGKLLEIPVPICAQRRFVLEGWLLNKLIDISLKIERLFKVPMDIEWGIKDGDIFILQARPITVVS